MFKFPTLFIFFMNDETLEQIVGIICITILEIVFIIYMKVDGAILSSVIGAITYLITRKRYKGKQK